ncbi:MAG TPA: four helix bundle protein [Candidatus Binatia bacterium]|nr:four helix bundle protein [Candidatus Binatia bacterium]
MVGCQRGYQSSLEVYRAMSKFPKEEIYGLVSQMRRSAASRPGNIAEGYRRRQSYSFPN